MRVSEESSIALALPTEILKCLNISTSEFGTMGSHRQVRACVDEFLSMVTKGVVHGVPKVVTPSSFSVIQPHKVSGGTWTPYHCDTRSHTIFFFLFIWGFTSLLTLYRSYHDG